MVNEKEAREAINRLWKTVPLGSGEDFNAVVKYIEFLERKINA